MNPIKQALLLMRRRRAARRLGVEFTRSIHWQTPTRLRIGGRMEAVSAPDEPGTRLAFLDILIDDCYGLRKTSGPVERVIDIGAHSGFFSLFAKMTFPQAIVHAYEPNSALTPFIQHQAEVGGFQWFSEAVGEHGGNATLTAHHDSVCSRAVEAVDGAIMMTAFSKVLDRIDGNADFLKLDCEGAEWSILKDKASMRKVRNLGMEYHLFDGHTERELTETVTAHGFTIHYLCADGVDYGRLWASR